VAPDQADSIPAVEAIYPMTAGLTPKVLGKAIREAVSRVPELPEWIDPHYLRRQAWPGWNAALASAHHPKDEGDLLPSTPARQRLAFDELLANQLALALVRAHQRRMPGRRIKGTGKLTAKVIAALPFKLTASQESAFAEVKADMESESRMLRLLQGDVGSGKTIVALLAMLTAVEQGSQAALLAPTEILARQHFATIEPLLAAAGVRGAILTGRDKRDAGSCRERTRVR
jgi:ATP-dependent DNA helicase RecG